MGMKPRKAPLAVDPRFLRVVITDQYGHKVDEFGVADAASMAAADTAIAGGSYDIVEVRAEATDIEERIVWAWHQGDGE